MESPETDSESSASDLSSDDVIKKKVTPKEIEKWEVALLSSKIESCNDTTGLIEKFESKRKGRHECLLQKLAKNLHEVNLKTEKNITMSSTELKAHMKIYEEKLADILNEIDKPEVTSFSCSVFTKLQKQASEYKNEQEKLINELYEDLKKFEDQRADENEKCLQLACEEMRKIGYFFPYEVQMFVEHETLKMNQLSLNNRRCYEDVKLTLTLVTEQAFKSFIDKLYCIREKWLQRKLVDTLQDFENKAEKKMSEIAPNSYCRLEVKGQELVLDMMPNNLYSTCKVEEWSKNVEEIITTLDFHGQTLINIYRETVEAVYKGFDKEVKEIKEQMSMAECLSFEERIIQPIVFQAETDRLKEIEELESFWQRTLEEIRTHLKDLTEFLLDAGKLWDRHLERVCESKKLILKALEKDQKNNQDVLQDLEVKLNIALDALRQEFNEGKLQKAYQAVMDILNTIKSKYESMYLADVSTIEDFYKMMDLEADVLAADIKEFVYETHPMDPSKIVHCFSDQYPYMPKVKPIIREIQFCAGKIQAVKSWKKGAWVALETLSNRAKETLQPRAESWVDKKIKFLAEQKSIQLELLDKRILRINSEIYEKRLEEITAHQEQFENHKEKSESEVTKMKEALQFLIEKESYKLDLIKESLMETETNARTENRARVIHNNQNMLLQKKEELEGDIKMTFERFRADCNTLISDLKQDNIKYMKSIKLFHEKGNYNSEEGKNFVASLESLDKKIDSDIKIITKDSSKEENEFIKKLSALFNPVISLLTLLYEETLFNQDAQQKLRSISTEIREYAKDLKMDYGLLSRQAYCLCMAVKRPKKNMQDNEEIIWKDVVELLYKNICNLFFPVPPPDYPLEIKSSEEEKEEKEEKEASQKGEDSTKPCCCGDNFSVHLSVSKTFTHRTAEKEYTSSCKDYKPELFNVKTPPRNEGTFIAVICCLFWTEMGFFQSLACGFYKKLQGRKLIRTDLIPPDYDAFMNKIISKLKNYNLQIEQFWLQIILDFLALFGRIKSLANRYLEQKLLTYESLAAKALEDFKKDFLDCLESQKSENSKELENLENKLLPLHGYPLNENLLNDLEENIVKKTAKQGVKWETIIKKFRNQVKCFRVHHIQERKEISKLETKHIKLEATVFKNNITEEIIKIVSDYCSKGEIYIKNTSGNPKSDTMSLTIKEDSKDDNLFIDMIEQNRLNVEYYKNKLMELLERERLPDFPPSECPPCTDSEKTFEEKTSCEKLCDPKLNIMLEIIDFNESAMKILNGLDRFTRRLKSFANSQEKTHELELFSWLNKWKINVRKVLRLYRVRYEEKPENLEEVVEVQSGTHLQHLQHGIHGLVSKNLYTTYHEGFVLLEIQDSENKGLVVKRSLLLTVHNRTEPESGRDKVVMAAASA